MKKIYLLLTVLILTLSCQKEEIITNEEKDSNLLSTVDEKEALHILSREKSKNNFKSQNETYAVPDFENLHYKEITNSDALLTIIPASVPDNAESQILMLKIENEIQTVVLSMYPDSQHNIDFSGVFIIRNLYGNFKEGYRVENGRIIAKLVKTKSKLKTGWEDGDWNDGELGEVIVDAPGGNRNTTPVKYVFVIRIHDEPGRNGEDWEFEYSSGGGGGGTTTTPTEEEEEEEEEDKIDNNLTDPCAKEILEELLELSRQNGNNPSLLDQFNHETGLGLYFSEAILNFLESSDDFVYIVGNNSSVSGTGRTDPRVYYDSVTDKYKIYSDFNTTYLNTATRLSMARTMIHESMHAYLIFERQRDYTDHIHEALNNYAKSNGYLPGGDGNLIHHNFMAQFVDAIAYQLAVWDKKFGTGTDLGWQYYHDLAWGGLANYEVNGAELFYKEFENYLRNLDDPTTAKDESLAVKDRILKIIANEAANNLNAKGNDCP